MKKTILLLSSFIFLITSSLFAITGDLSAGGTVTSLASGVYTVPAGNFIEIPTGCTFTFKTGVQINFEDYSFLITYPGSKLIIEDSTAYHFYSDARFQINGDLFILGTPSNGVWFDEHVANTGDSWNGINFDYMSADTVMISNAHISQTRKYTGGGFSDLSGGGICVDNSAFDIFEVHSSEFVDNRASNYGGAICFQNSSCSSEFIIEYTVLNDNGSGLEGGTIYTDQTNLKLIACDILGGSTSNLGGGLLAKNTKSIKIEYCGINGNYSANNGGGLSFIYNNGIANPEVLIKNSQIGENNAQRGGGIHVYNGLSTNLNFRLLSSGVSINNAFVEGGGMSVYDLCNAVYVLKQNTLIKNNSLNKGGALFLNATLTSCFNIKLNEFRENTAIDGAGIFVNNASSGKVTLMRNIFKSNFAEIDGGACMFTGQIRRLSVEVNEFVKNEAISGNGGAIMHQGLNHLTPMIIYLNKFESNVAGNDGGALCGTLETVAQKKVLNNLFVNNSAAYNGGAIYCERSYNFLNNTIADNNAGASGGGIYATTNAVGIVGIMNNIIWDNSPTPVNNILSVLNTYPNFNYCDINGPILFSGTNITLNPLFVTPGTDYSLQSTSPCINAGDPTFVPTSVYAPWNIDIRFSTRIMGSAIDMGAYESTVAKSSEVEFESTVLESVFKVYPNPVTDYLNIDFGTRLMSNLEVSMFDISGKLIFTLSSPYTMKDHINIDVSEFPEGIYMLKVQYGKTMKSEKIIIE